jgi:hypothetical protein
MAKKLKLSMVPTFMREEAEKQFAAGNVTRMLILMPNTECLEFVAHNAEALIRRGIYEPALFSAFTGTRTNHASYPQSTIRYVFNMADRRKLLAAGDPLPPGDTYTVYRGVAGGGQRGRLSGPSWTGDVERAKWFAMRFAPHTLPNPAVLVATVRRDDVYFYSGERGEQEFVVFVDRPKEMDIDLGMPADDGEAAVGA